MIMKPMTPIEFVTDNGSEYNLPCGDFFEAIKKPLIIRSAGCNHQVLSYYYDDVYKCMVIDIEEIKP